MDFITNNLLLIAVAVASGGMLLLPVLRAPGAGALTAPGAVQLINREKGVVVDVSETEEFAAAHVAGARNLTLNQLEQPVHEVAKNKAQLGILVCATASRANRALVAAKKLGYERSKVLAGGLKAWKD